MSQLVKIKQPDPPPLSLPFLHYYPHGLGLNFEKTFYLNYNFPIQWSAIITPEKIR